MNTAIWIKGVTISAFILAGILLVLLCLTTLYEPAKKKAHDSSDDKKPDSTS